ncbi:hypothetical protein LPJ73_000350 [Coemansia sp. RSA 2703]|nr:hypothetical protein LPJ73_000350 [Coemansia sp. RSA 2703]
MGADCGPGRISPPVPQCTSPIPTACDDTLAGGGSGDSRDRSNAAGGGDNRRDTRLIGPIRVQDLHGPREGQDPPAAQPQALERAPTSSTFQDGRTIYIEGNATKRGLYGQVGCALCIHGGAGAPGPSAVLVLPVHGAHVHVPLPGVWSCVSPAGLHEADARSSGTAENGGFPVRVVPRRLLLGPPGPDGTAQASGTNEQPPSRIRLCGPRDEIGSGTEADPGFPRVLLQHENDAHSGTVGQGQEPAQECTPRPPGTNDTGQETGFDNRRNGSSDAGSRPGAATGTPPPDLPSPRTSEHTELGARDESLARGETGVAVVARPLATPPCVADPGQTAPGDRDTDRRLQHGLVSGLAIAAN